MIAIEHQLMIGGKLFEPISSEVTLEVGGVGRGVFHVRSDVAFSSIGSGAVQYLSGFRSTGMVVPVLTGLLVDDAAVGDGERRIVVREPAMLLDTVAPMALRGATPADVLAEIEAATGLIFLLPDSGDYLTERQPYFAAAGTCRDALDSMAPAWGVPRGIWASLPDGRIYWGDWLTSPFNRAAVAIDPSLVQERDPEAQSLILPWMPKIRPGLVLSVDFPFMVQRARFSGDNTTIQWGEV